MPKDREDMDGLKASLSITAVAERLGHAELRGKIAARSRAGMPTGTAPRPFEASLHRRLRTRECTAE